jgi:hypothetical protein
MTDTFRPGPGVVRTVRRVVTFDQKYAEAIAHYKRHRWDGVQPELSGGENLLLHESQANQIGLGLFDFDR